MTYIPTWSPPDPPEECEGEKCPDCGGCSRYLRDTDNTGAVSYTHLRAHETVLDLVCRLLLEKKKKTN